MRRSVGAVMALVVGTAACSELQDEPFAPGAAQFTTGVSTGGTVPRVFNETNISGDACLDPRVNPTGASWLGFKIEDPVVGGTWNGIDIAISGTEGQFLAWSAIASRVVHAVVVKGNNDTHVYDYNPAPSQGDAGLHSPLNKQGNVPAISHYVICYTQLAVNEGCTPGYWKNRAQTTGDWALVGRNSSDALNTAFTFPSSLTSLGNTSLLAALDLSGGTGVLGGARILLRAATAALLNAAHPDVSYPLTPGDVVAQVNAALAKGSDTDAQWRARILTLAATLDAHNNAGCPLGAMRN